MPQKNSDCTCDGTTRPPRICRECDLKWRIFFTARKKPKKKAAERRKEDSVGHPLPPYTDYLDHWR